MKFKFCGDVEPPEWILATVSYLSRLSAVRIRLISGQLVKFIKDGTFEKAKMWKMCKESGLSDSETEATISAIHFILVTACKFDTTPELLTDEIGQLGMPVEHAKMIAKAYSIDLEGMRQALINKHLKLDRVDSLQWRADFELRREIADVRVQLKKTTGESVKIAMTSDMLGMLLMELNKAKTIMANLS